MAAPKTENAGFWIRTPAIMIDSSIGAMLFFVLLWRFGLKIAGAASFAIGLGYYVYFWTTSGQTLGHRAFGLKVVSAEDGNPIDTGAAISRYFGFFLAALPLGIGLMWAGWDKRKQGLHDKLADSVVVEAA